MLRNLGAILRCWDCHIDNRKWIISWSLFESCMNISDRCLCLFCICDPNLVLRVHWYSIKISDQDGDIFRLVLVVRFWGLYGQRKKLAWTHDVLTIELIPHSLIEVFFNLTLFCSHCWVPGHRFYFEHCTWGSRGLASTSICWFMLHSWGCCLLKVLRVTLDCLARSNFSID